MADDRKEVSVPDDQRIETIEIRFIDKERPITRGRFEIAVQTLRSLIKAVLKRLGKTIGLVMFVAASDAST